MRQFERLMSMSAVSYSYLPLLCLSACGRLCGLSGLAAPKDFDFNVPLSCVVNEVASDVTKDKGEESSQDNRREQEPKVV